MRFIFLISLTFLLSVSAVVAETIVVKSADHRDRTRIVLHGDVDELDANRISGGISVSFPPEVTKIDMEKFFHRISRDRVSKFEIDMSRNEIRFSLSCECELLEEHSLQNMFIIDLLDAGVQELRESTLNRKEWNSTFNSRRRKLEFPVTMRAKKNVEHQGKMDSSVDEVSLDSFPVFFHKNMDASQRLIEHIEWNKIQVTEDVFDSSIEKSKSQMELHSSSENYLIRNGLNDSENDSCMSSSSVDPKEWPKYENVQKFLTSQKKIFDDSSRNEGDGSLRNMAISYLAVAMGAESRALLNSIENPTKTDEVLINFSEYVDGAKSARNVEPIFTILSCPELIAMRLAIYGAEGDQGGPDLSLSKVDLERIRKDFDQWPDALRGVFVSKLADALLDVEASDVAEFSLRRAAGQGEGTSGERAIVAAKIARFNQKDEAAVSILEPVIAQDSDRAPEAVLAIAELSLEEGAELQEREKVALQSYSEEYKGSELEIDLIRARLRSAVQDGDFPSAIELLTPYSRLARKSQVDLILDEVGERVFRLESDAAFLKEAVSLPAPYFNRMAREKRESIETRMINLGFSELSAQLGKLGREGDVGSKLETTEAVAPMTEATAFAERNETEKPNDLDRSVGEIDASEGTADNLVRIEQPPIAKVVEKSEDLLEDVALLKQELMELGL